MTEQPWMIAYRIGHRFDMPVVPATRWREWLAATPGHSANRCLPLLMANQAGWALLNPTGFRATWEGESDPDSVRFEWDEQVVSGAAPVLNNFGFGVISWRVPFLFRTPPGWNLLARGPANWPRDGAAPLEGLIETDWAVATFTMNWKLTRPGHPVRFDRGEPICMVVPQRRGELESFSTSVRPLEQDPDIAELYKKWSDNRHERNVRRFLLEHDKDFGRDWTPWILDYFKGLYPGGAGEAPEHQTKLQLGEFAESSPEDPRSA